MKSKIALFVLIGVLVIGCLLLVAGYSYGNGLRHKGITEYEVPISAQYQACQITYSAYTAGFQEQFGVYNANLKGLDQFMSDAIKGRYDKTDSSGQPTGVIDANIFIQAIAEAYPDTNGITDLAGKLMDYVQGQREAFKGCQEKLVDMLNNYKGWRNGDIIDSLILKHVFGFPTDNLVARLGDQEWTGQAAEDKMFQLVLSSNATEAYQSGVDQPLLPMPTP